MEETKIQVFFHPGNSAEARIFNNTFNDLILDPVKAQNKIIENENVVHIGSYTDAKYINFAKKRKNCIVSICDLYSILEIIELDKIFCGFIVPTENHASILKLIVEKPVFIIGESADPLFKNYQKSFFTEKKLCWFGYNESFNKSMIGYSKIIENELKSGHIKDFTIISNTLNKMRVFPGFNFVKYSDETVSAELGKRNYCILSHSPIDLHINTIIKSPNKLISAINSGLLPICSATPSYTLLMKKIGLGNYVFETPSELSRIIQNLNPDTDRVLLASAFKELEKHLSSEKARNIKTLKYISPRLLSNDSHGIYDGITITDQPGIKESINLLKKSIKTYFNQNKEKYRL